ncbi:MAG TPA: hypothetical protein VFD89_03525 [Clostridia bacterium]|nr:hypothetical protein [Clostridia bacterium]
MPNIKEAMDRIRILQCPTGQLEERVANILEDHNISPKSEILISREKRLDKDGAEAYTVTISDRLDPAITLLAKSGIDDYVVQIKDIYFN